MKEKCLSLLLALVMCLGLTATALAADAAPEIEIMWLGTSDIVNLYGCYYVSELDWVSFWGSSQEGGTLPLFLTCPPAQGSTSLTRL